MNFSDIILIEQIKKNDKEATEKFIRRYYTDILRYSYLRLSPNSYVDAEDITQDVFISFFNNINNYNHTGKALNYLYIIAGNKIKDFYKKKRELVVEHNDIISSTKYETTLSDTELNLKLDIESAIQKLPKEIRDVAILFFFQDLKQKDIAKILAIDLSLVKYRVSRSKILLEELLNDNV